MPQLETHRWARETESALNEARSAIAESRSDDVRRLVEELPSTIGSEDAPVSLAFAGQYSAGKSTILKALTGRNDIATGAGITTVQTHRYDWDGVAVVDTPGIHTSIRPDHDATAYAAIGNSDLLVFVITNELFDSHLAEHYRKLTIDRDKGHETILVVNKMGRHARGNTPESQGVIAEDLRAPLHPFTPEQLRITFTDAESALEAQSETDPEFRAMLTEQGNLPSLIANLNDLVREKGLNARHTTALYAIDQVLQTAIQLEPTEDTDADNLILIYNRNIRAITDAKRDLETAIRTTLQDADDKIRAVGSDLSEHFYPDSKEDKLERAVDEAERQVGEIVKQLGREIERRAEETLPTLGNRLNGIESSDLYKETLRNINSRRQSRDWSGAFRVAAEGVERLAGLAGKFSAGDAHRTILNIGHRIGYRFRPWQAVKMAGFVGRASRFLPLLGVAIEIGVVVLSDHQEERNRRELAKIRQDIRVKFADIGAEVREAFTDESQQVIKEMLDDPLERAIHERDELNRQRQVQNAHLERLNAASVTVSALIRRIHEESDG